MMSTRTGVRALVMVTLCYGALEIVGLLLLWIRIMDFSLPGAKVPGVELSRMVLGAKSPVPDGYNFCGNGWGWLDFPLPCRSLL